MSARSIADLEEDLERLRTLAARYEQHDLYAEADYVRARIELVLEELQALRTRDA